MGIPEKCWRGCWHRCWQKWGCWPECWHGCWQAALSLFSPKGPTCQHLCQHSGQHPHFCQHLCQHFSGIPISGSCTRISTHESEVKLGSWIGKLYWSDDEDKWAPIAAKKCKIVLVKSARKALVGLPHMGV